MASQAPVTADTPVTIKANIDGVARRFKIPLRDVGINVFEAKLREALNIPADADAVFERYSDSAATYVVLDQANTAVYKQLYRAAKAKHKLKLRVTVKQPEPEEEKQAPQPASVTDEAEEENHPSVEPTDTERETEQATPLEKSTEPSPVETAPAPVVDDKPADQTTSQPADVAEANETNEQTMDALIRDFLEHVTPLPPTIVHGAPSSPRPAAGGSDLRATYAVCCNNCDRTIPDAHYHCATCDDGDFDLCQDCVDRGVSCKGTNHWMIKRFVKDGVIINSTTERLAPKPKPKPHANPAPAPAPAPVPVAERIIPLFNDFVAMRTCNCCVADLPEAEFVHCTTCDDYDLCTSCFVKNKHGHHPGHAFVPVDTKARLPREVYLLLEPGRDVIHNAICDSCNLTIHGVRHKCLDCPDWDYCSICVRSAHDLHPGHRFAPIYEPLEYKARLQGAMFAPTHFGICCDGPLCVKNHTSSTYIVGDRYKCAVCNDTDFCASCEASPLNTHNRTHPLIKFKTPVRHVSVTTTGETHGRPLRTMGDRPSPSRSAGTCPFAQPNPSSPSVIRGVQTVVDVKPSEPVKEEKTEKVAPVAAPPAAAPKPVRDDELAASYIRDTVVDGTVFEPDHVFKQTWILRNTGHVAWPADCFVRFVSGDYMGSLASDHPAKTQDVQYSFQSAPCTTSIQPGEEFGFTVCLRSPPKPGRYTSYWRLSTKEGTLFGHRLWCDIAVKLKELSRPAAPAVERAEVKAEPEVQPEHSQMIFPKLEKESPTASVHQVVKTEEPVAVSTNPEEYDDCDDADWRDGDSEEGFLTDEEYDILDASDEEFNSALNGKKN